MTETDSPSRPLDDTEADQAPEALSAVLEACTGFLDDAATFSSPLAAIIDSGSATLDRQLPRLESELESSGRLEWHSISTYITSVQDSIIDPLQRTLAENPVVSSTAVAWDRANETLDVSLDRLSTKNRLEISPHRRFIEGIANVIAELEFGISSWVNVVVGAASALPRADDEAVDINDRPDSVAADPAPAPFVAAGNDLRQRLFTAAERIESLRTEILKGIESAARAQLGKLQKVADAAATEEPAVSQAIDDLAEWTPWFEQVEARMNLSSARCSLFHSAVEVQDELFDSVRNESLGAWFEAIQQARKAMETARATAIAAFEELPESTNLRPAVRNLVELLRTTTGLLDTQLTSTLDIDSAVKSIETVCRRAVVDLQTAIQSLPGTLVVHATGSAADIKSSASTREVDLRAAASAAIAETVTPDAWTWSEAIQARLGTLSDDADNLQPVLRFHLGGAIEELRDASGSRTTAELREDAKSAARELAVSGLDRAAEVLAKLEADLLRGIDEASIVVSDIRQTFWSRVNERTVAETAQEKLTLQLESTAGSAQRAFQQQAQEMLRQTGSFLSGQAKRTYTQLHDVFNRGRAAIVGNAEPVKYETTINALAQLNAIRSRLPVVYRRLFSFHPLNDDSLMAGRDEDMQWLTQQLKARRRGHVRAIVITGQPGCGVTTFIDAARHTCLRDARYCSINLGTRIDSEAVLVRKIADALEFGELDDGEATFISLANRILGEDDSAPSRVCVIERLEHTFIRQIGGFELVAGMLRFMSETASRILWIATTSNSAWQLLARNEQTAQGLVSHYRMSGYDRSELEEVIDRRHRRSALSISFDPPADASPILQRKIRRAKTEEEKQSLYRSAYFDKLFSTSGQNIMLALFYWLLSVRYRQDSAEIRVRGMPQLNFDSLADLSGPELFALKAFLEHGSLTVGEYCEIANVDKNVGLEIFESLGNALIVERTRDEDTGLMDVDFERFNREGRYRVRPLLVQPIIRALRAKNIVH